MKLMRAILHTSERAEAEQDANWKRFYETINGMNALVMPSGFSDDYVFCGAGDEESRNTFKEAAYIAEQDEMMGAYINQRDEFEEDWNSGDYDPCSVMVLEPQMVEVIAEIEAT